MSWSQSEDGSLPDFIRIDSFNNIISVNTSDTDNIGTYRLTMTARPDLGEPGTADIVIDIGKNTLPRFISADIKDQVIRVNKTSKYVLPKYRDMESEVYVSASLKGLSYLPSFISFSKNRRTFTFTPDEDDVKEWEIEVTLTESTGFEQVKEYFKVTVLEPEEIIDPDETYMNGTMTWDPELQVASLTYD